MNKDAYYFPHDANARRDKKVIKMLSKYKYGYQWYFMTIEILREETRYKYTKSDIDALAMELREEYHTINEWLEDCINHYGLFETDGIHFWSNSLIERMLPMENRREKNKENNAKRWAKYKESKEIMPLQYDGNANSENGNTMVIQSKGKESKGEESKEIELPQKLHSLESCLSVATYEGYSSEEGQKFFDFYNSQGWKRGKSQALITDLVSAFRAWISRAGEMGITPSKAGKLNQTNL